MLKVSSLRCEYRENPVGIDVLRPRLSWIVEADRRNVMQSAYQLQVSQNDSGFSSPVWDTGKVASGSSVHVEYAGPALKSCCRYYYRVRIWDNCGNGSDWSGAAFWEMGILSGDEWQAEWITPGSEAFSGNAGGCPMLRTVFDVKGKVKAARIYITSLGLYQLRVNGSCADGRLFTPGWTSYRKRLEYQTYDVTHLLKEGKNALGVVLGEGWFMGGITWYRFKGLYGDKPGLLAQLQIEYDGGATQKIVSDDGWKWSAGPILKSDLYDGEIYDARLEKNGWDTAEYDDTGWSCVQKLGAYKGVLEAQSGLPVGRVEELKPIAMFTTPRGETVLDMGQNMVGWVRFNVQGAQGSRVALSHAEILDGEGNFYTANLRKAEQKIEYILKGGGPETFEPHFTFQGFRYVRIDEYPGKPSPDSFTGVVIHSGMEVTGSFECSNSLLNQLQSNIKWGQKGNFLDVPTDCPQRDERLGWTGDAQMFARTACFNMNTAPFFTKWLKDLKADQLQNGGVPYVIPHVLEETAHSSAAWGDAAVICPWTVYLCYGDERILENQYDSMKKWVEYIRSQGDDEYLWNTGFHFGDWVALDAKEGSYIGATSRDFIATAFYAYSTRLLASAAEVLGKIEDADEYSGLYGNILRAFRKEFVTPSGRLAVPTQTAHVLALVFDLVEEKDRKRTADTLVRYLEENDFHLNTGFVGTPYICHALSGTGHTDVAYKLLLKTDYPSWLYQVTKGATTIWEHLDGIKPDGSLWSADMNSFNHYAYGAVGDWMYRVAAGIDTDEKKTGYKHIILRPHPTEELEYVKAELKSMYGQIESGWSFKDGVLQVTVNIPHNTTATLILPQTEPAGILENGRSMAEAGLADNCTVIPEGVSIKLGSGAYSFSCESLR